MTATEQAKAYLSTLPEPIREFEAQQIIRDLIAEREAVCTWVYGVTSRYWLTDCGEAFEIIAGGPDANGLRYCCFCGRKLAESRP